MRFWDASAVVPLLVIERPTPRMKALAISDPAMSVWWACKVECISAVMRLEREGNLESKLVVRALARLVDLEDRWNEVEANEALKEVAVRLLRVHPLRAADALQLAAAYFAADQRPTSYEFVTLDSRLASAARKEGFSVIDAES
jgi:hypothetical protein